MRFGMGWWGNKASAGQERLVVNGCFQTTMDTTASQRLLTIALPSYASVTDQGAAMLLHVKRGTLEVVVTVPRSVREWFVDASDVESGARAADWCDYDGYDISDIERRDLDMAEDVLDFVNCLLSRELKLEKTRGRAKLLWKVSDVWEQAVPFWTGSRAA